MEGTTNAIHLIGGELVTGFLTFSTCAPVYVRRMRSNRSIRVARHTDRLAEVVAFYRDGLGQREAGRLEDHDGFRVAPEASIGEDLPRGDGLADDA